MHNAIKKAAESGRFYSTRGLSGLIATIDLVGRALTVSIPILDTNSDIVTLFALVSNPPLDTLSTDAVFEQHTTHFFVGSTGFTTPESGAAQGQLKPGLDIIEIEVLEATRIITVHPVTLVQRVRC